MELQFSHDSVAHKEQILESAVWSILDGRWALHNGKGLFDDGYSRVHFVELPGSIVWRQNLCFMDRYTTKRFPIFIADHLLL